METLGRRLDGRSVVDEDLDAIVAASRSELDTLSDSTLLVTGGGGFLGYYLIQCVLRYNAGAPAPIRLTVIDNFMRGTPAWLADLARRAPAAFELVAHDVTRALDASHAPYDYIMHAASIASPVVYRKHPIETIDANVWGLRALLEHYRRTYSRERPGCLLFFSSSEIYGDPDPAHIPTRETYHGNVSCTGPRACYDESKRFGETLCVNFAASYGLPIVSVRPFNNFGPGLNLDDRRVVPDFAAGILAGRDIEVFSDGSPTRTFCYVTDAISGYLKALVRGRPGEAYNIGVEQPEISVAQLAELMRALAHEHFGYTGRVVFGNPRDGQYLTDNPGRRCPCIDKARDELGYRPTVPLAEGLRRTLTWYSASGN